jgi:hypothetical protein
MFRLALLLAFAASPAVAADKPNVVVILADDKDQSERWSMCRTLK